MVASFQSCCVCSCFCVVRSRPSSRQRKTRCEPRIRLPSRRSSRLLTMSADLPSQQQQSQPASQQQQAGQQQQGGSMQTQCQANRQQRRRRGHSSDRSNAHDSTGRKSGNRMDNTLIAFSHDSMMLPLCCHLAPLDSLRRVLSLLSSPCSMDAVCGKQHIAQCSGIGEKNATPLCEFSPGLDRL